MVYTFISRAMSIHTQCDLHHRGTGTWQVFGTSNYLKPGSYKFSSLYHSMRVVVLLIVISNIKQNVMQSTDCRDTNIAGIRELSLEEI